MTKAQRNQIKYQYKHFETQVAPVVLDDVYEDDYDPDIQVFRDQYETLKREEYEE